MRINKTSKWLIALFALALVLVLLPLGMTEAQPVANYGFIPNSGEASVSKVDLVSMTEVARYYTAPRVGDEVDLVGNPTPDVPNTINPNSWRTSRIAQDTDGNSWVINVGADGTNLQGSIVRVQADTEGLNTHEYDLADPDTTPPFLFGTDEAVQIFPVGSPGDMPRAIAIDSAGYIWVGFYSGAQLMKYEYNAVAGTLSPVDGPFMPASGTIRYYEMKFAPDGTLFISSRGSTPARTPRTEGIFSFNGTSFVRETTFNPYSILINQSSGAVYATAYNNLIYWRDSQGAWSSDTVPGTSNNRGMAFDSNGIIWIASTTGASGGSVVGWWDPLSTDKGHITLNTAVGTTPVGVGRDEAGLMWAICRTDGVAQGFIQAFNPTVKSGLNSVGSIQVGNRPYAYGDFTVEPPDEPCYYRDTVWAYGGETDPATYFGDVNGVAFHNNKVASNPSNAWGWTNFITEADTYVFDVWAGAGQNDTNRGTLAGTVTVNVEEQADGSFCATVTGFDLDPNILIESHVWIGDTPLFVNARGRVTAAPGQFPYDVGDKVCGLSAEGFYIAIHGVVGILVPCP